MVFNATFNNISVISLPSIILVEETGVPGETTDLPQVTRKLYHIMYRVSRHEPDSNLQLLVVIGTDCTGITYKSNYHTTAMAPVHFGLHDGSYV